MREIQLWRMVGGSNHYPQSRKFIPVTKSQVADGHYNYINADFWLLAAAGYAYRREGRKIIFQHRVVADLLGWPKGIVDHVDPNEKLNNQPYNLRLATSSQNGANRRLSKNSTTGEKNISWRRDIGKYLVQIRLEGKRVYCVLFDTLDEARIAAVAARLKFHQEFARHG